MLLNFFFFFFFNIVLRQYFPEGPERLLEIYNH